MFDQIPNVLTIVRIVLTLFAIVLVSFDITNIYTYLLIVFIIAAVTDWADGYLARKYHIVSDFGKVFDPLADKVLAFVLLIMLYGSGVVAPVIILLLIVRDLVIDNVRAFFASKVVIPAIFTAKAKTATIFALIILALVTLALEGNTYTQLATTIVAYMSLALSYISAAQYAHIFYREYTRLKTEDATSSNV